MTVPEIWSGQNRGGKKKKKKKRKKYERGPNHIASPAGIAKYIITKKSEFIIVKKNKE